MCSEDPFRRVARICSDAFRGSVPHALRGSVPRCEGPRNAARDPVPTHVASTSYRLPVALQVAHRQPVFEPPSVPEESGRCARLWYSHPFSPLREAESEEGPAPGCTPSTVTGGRTGQVTAPGSREPATRAERVLATCVGTGSRAALRGPSQRGTDPRNACGTDPRNASEQILATHRNGSSRGMRNGVSDGRRTAVGRPFSTVSYGLPYGRHTGLPYGCHTGLPYGRLLAV